MISSLRSLAFGDVEAEVWGAACLGDGSDRALLGLGAAGATGARPVTVEGERADGGWTVRGDDVELRAEPIGEPVAAVWDLGGGGFDQLCRLEGRFTLDGREHSVRSLGYRGTRSGLDRSGPLETIRVAVAWFEPEEGLALVALRPGGARGHDSDLVSAAVLHAHEAAPVTDPRLSTTYAGGRPARASLELWVGAEGEEEEQQYPRRAAGEAVGPRLELQWGELEVDVELFRWHGRGQEGAGIYLLTRPR